MSYKHTEEAKRKIGLAALGRKGALGYKHTEEAKKKISAASKVYMVGKHPSKESRQKNRDKHIGLMTGEKHWAWIPDRTKLSKGDEYRNSPAHREWSRSVKNRDCWKCMMSNGDCSGHVEAHHILSWRDYPELRYELKNGITLCRFHHPKRRSDEMKLSPYFQSLVINNSN